MTHHVPPRRRIPEAGREAEWGRNVCPGAHVVVTWPQERQQCPDCCEALIRCKCGGGE